ncbi:MAG: hypothetical protein QM820_44725 [Minicystis sp.]
MSAKPSLRDLAARNRDLIVITLAALVVRLAWNLAVHRPLDYAFSDMSAYMERAQAGLSERAGYFTFFPWGTHVMLGVVIRALGAGNAVIGSLYALIGAGAVAYGFLLARRLTRSVGLARVVGGILVVYYPWIAVGGYVLSEPPFALCLTASAYHGLLLADRGRPRDAWLFGLWVAAAAAFRPQILLALPLYGLHWLVRRRAWRRITPRLAIMAAAPLVLVLGLSAARTRYHTGKLGLISTNGPLNFAFGRCHATKISSFVNNKRSGSYSPPSLNALSRYGSEHPDALFTLNPAMDTSLQFDGQMWDSKPIYWMASQCVRQAGIGRQIEYAVTHVVMLWHYNVMWPDQNTKPPFKSLMEISGTLHEIFVLPAALAAVALAFRRRNARIMLVGLHVIALLGVAVLYFGDTRLRAPYDGILVLLAAMAYASGYRLIRRRRARAAVT